MTSYKKQKYSNSKGEVKPDILTCTVTGHLPSGSCMVGASLRGNPDIHLGLTVNTPLPSLSCEDLTLRTPDVVIMLRFASSSLNGRV